MRVIALAPHIVELVYAAGAQDRLVAVVNGSDFPAEASQLSRLGDGTHLSIERVLGLKPDLLLAWQPAPLRSLLPWLDRYNVPVTHIDPLSLDAVADAVEQLGDRLGTAVIAYPRAATLRQRIATLRQRHAHDAPVRVFVQVGTSPMFSLGASSILTDALLVCGGVNVMADTAIAAPLTSIEGALATRPQAILTGDDATATQAFWRDVGWPADGQSAVRVIALPADALYRPGPRLVDATETLCGRLDAIRQLAAPQRVMMTN
jgi:iron complex transport system substrate-binding protein/vitamin B12 transport system substrate-binding protein